MLNDSPVVRSPGPRILFLLGAIVTALILIWEHELRLRGEVPGLTAIFYVLFAFEDYDATVCELLILGTAVFFASRVPARSLLRATGEHPMIVALISLIVLCAGALGVYHNHPLSMDEYAPYFQSRVFAAGHVTGQFPLAQMDWLIPPGFQDFFLNVSHVSGQVASAYWPGHALIMTPFTLIGIPWACNPVLSALTVLVVHRLALCMFEDTEAAGLAILLTVASPVFFGNGISYYSMPSHLLANSLYALLLLRPTPAKALAAGVVGSIGLTLHNPVPHLLFALPWLIWIVTRRGGVRLLACLCAGYLPLFLLLGVGWFEFSNHLRAEGQNLLTAKADAADRFKDMLAVFSAPTATVFLSRSIALAKIWVWAVPGLLILAGYGAFRERGNTACRLFTASALATLIGYIFFSQDQGHGWGYRYFHSAWMALPLLATAALFRPVDPAASTQVSGSSRPGIFEDPETRAFVTACVILTLVFGVGIRAWQMQSFIADDISQLPHYPGSERHVVILDPSLMFYGGDLVQNDPWLRGSEIRMMSHGRTEDRQMMARYYQNMHQVYADHHASVWSADPSIGHDARQR